MSPLSNDDVQAMGRAVSLDIQEPDLSQVAYSINAMLEAMDKIDVPGLTGVEPIPIIPPFGLPGR